MATTYRNLALQFVLTRQRGNPVKHLLPLFAVTVAFLAIITCTGYAVDENAQYRDGCKYCGRDGFIGEDDIQHARSKAYPSSGLWKVGFCPNCQTGKNLLSSTAPQQARPAPLTATPTYQQQQPTVTPPARSLPPPPAPRVEWTDNGGVLYNDSNVMLLSATVLCDISEMGGGGRLSLTTHVGSVPPGGSVNWRLGMNVPAGYYCFPFVLDYKYQGD